LKKDLALQVSELVEQFKLKDLKRLLIQQRMIIK